MSVAEANGYQPLGHAHVVDEPDAIILRFPDPEAGDTEGLREDSELVEQVRAGDQAAFGELYERHYEVAVRVAKRMTSAKDEAEDAVQEAFIKVLQAIERGGGPRQSFRPYLLMAVQNTIISWGRKVPASTLSLDHDDAPEVPEATDYFANSVERDLVTRAFTALPERWQRVLWKVDVEGQSYEEVGGEFGMSATAVGALVYRAREGLKTTWLQAHLQGKPQDDACRAVHGDMGSFHRRRLSRRRDQQVTDHVSSCMYCSDLIHELEVLEPRLPLFLPPALVLVLMGLLDSSKIAALFIGLGGAGAGKSAGSASLAARNTRRLERTKAQSFTIVAAAVGVVALVGGTAFAAHHFDLFSSQDTNGTINASGADANNGSGTNNSGNTSGGSGAAGVYGTDDEDDDSQGPDEASDPATAIDAVPGEPVPDSNVGANLLVPVRPAPTNPVPNTTVPNSPAPSTPGPASQPSASPSHSLEPVDPQPSPSQSNQPTFPGPTYTEGPVAPVDPDPSDSDENTDTEEPTEENPTEEPTEEPSVEPTPEPSPEPTEEPTPDPTVDPSEEPSVEPSPDPTVQPTEEPTEEPTVEPTEEPTIEPTEEPTEEPSEEPTEDPTPDPIDYVNLSVNDFTPAANGLLLPPITGTGVAGNEIELIRDGQSIATTTAAADGTWELSGDLELYEGETFQIVETSSTTPEDPDALTTQTSELTIPTGLNATIIAGTSNGGSKNALVDGTVFKIPNNRGEYTIYVDVDHVLLAHIQFKLDDRFGAARHAPGKTAGFDDRNSRVATYFAPGEHTLSWRYVSANSPNADHGPWKTVTFFIE